MTGATDQGLQREVCAKFGVPCEPPVPTSKVGISQSALDGVMPINALRHPADGDTCGWYVWGGEGDPGPTTTSSCRCTSRTFPIDARRSRRTLGSQQAGACCSVKTATSTSGRTPGSWTAERAGR